MLASTDSAALSSIKGALESAGFTVSMISTIGDTVAAMARDTPIGLLIVDHAFLLYSEFRSAVSRIPKSPVIPLLVLCSLHEPIIGLTGTDAPVYGFIDKNMRSDALVHSVQTALRLHSASPYAAGHPQKHAAQSGRHARTEPPEETVTGPKTDGIRFDLYRTLLDATDDIAYIKDDSLRYVMVNRACRDFFSKPERDLIGKTDSVLLGEEAAKSRLITDRQAIRLNRHLVSVEDSNGRVYESRKFPVLLDGGGTGIGAFMRDITETRRAEERLLASEKKLYLRNRIAQLFLTVPGDEIYDGILEVVREMLKSRLGIFGYLDAEERLVNVSMIGANEGSCGAHARTATSPFDRERPGGRCLAMVTPSTAMTAFRSRRHPALPTPSALRHVRRQTDRHNHTRQQARWIRRPRPGRPRGDGTLYRAPAVLTDGVRAQGRRASPPNRRSADFIGYGVPVPHGDGLHRPAGASRHIRVYRALLEELLPGYRILVNEFDPEDGTTVVRAVAGERGVVDSVMKLLGRSPVGLRTPMPAEHRNELLRQRVQIGPNGFYELSGRTLPELVCRAIDRLLDIGTVYGMGFARQDILYGNVLLIAPRGSSLEDTSIIEPSSAGIGGPSTLLGRDRARARSEKEFLPANFNIA